MKDILKEPRLTLKQKRIFSALSVIIFILFTVVVFWLIGKPMIRFVSEPAEFRSWVDSHGMWSRIAFVGMVVFQIIIAIIPGEPLEIGAGYAFGAVEGTVLCVIGNLIGGLLVFALVRLLGVRLLEVFFSREKINSLKFMQNTRRLNILTFVIFLIPGTPKDLLSYFVGLTNIKWTTWLLITGVARMPSVITSTIGGSALGTQKYLAAAVVFAVTVVISGCGLLLYRFICNKHKAKEENTSKIM